MQRRGMLSAAGALALARPAAACIWDRDTPQEEARGLPEMADLLAGRFPRNPALYYEMRLTRAASQIDTNVRDFAAYDDAGAACDRLGRSDEAVSWMAKKKAILDTIHHENTTEHRYRYLANLGTFLAHRWLRQTPPRNADDLAAARSHIAEALRLNPRAHFGRERYQLLAIEAMSEGVGAKPGDWACLLERPDWGEDKRRLLRQAFDSIADDGVLAKLGYSDAVKGLSGLIALGNAWESVDVFFTLSLALQHEGRSSIAYLARKRVRELFAAGQRSLVPGGPDPDAQVSHNEPSIPLEGEDLAHLDLYFTASRQNADRWLASRNEFMLQQLRRGEHPDTHPDFWKDYHDLPAIPLPGGHGGLRSVLLVGAAASLSGAILLYLLKRRKRASPTAPT